MRRILLLLMIAAVMAAMMLTSAIPAFAAALNPNANCYGYQASVSTNLVMGRVESLSVGLRRMEDLASMHQVCREALTNTIRRIAREGPGRVLVSSPSSPSC